MLRFKIYPFYYIILFPYSIKHFQSDMSGTAFFFFTIQNALVNESLIDLTAHNLPRLLPFQIHFLHLSVCYTLNTCVTHWDVLMFRCSFLTYPTCDLSLSAEILFSIWNVTLEANVQCSTVSVTSLCGLIRAEEIDATKKRMLSFLTYTEQNAITKSKK